MSQPEFLDGEPVNLEAAALDAVEWLRFWREFLNHNLLAQSWNGQRRRMSRAIRRLESYLPEGEPIYHETPKPPAYGAVATLDPVKGEEESEE